MIALTSRLNERDETIIQLQEELDAYDRITLETESSIESKQARIQQLEQFIKDECGRQVPNNPYANADSIHQVLVQPTYLNFSDGTASEDGELFEPHSKAGKDQSKLLSGKEKVAELQQLLEEKNLEITELKIQAEDQNPKQTQQLSHEMQSKKL